MDGSPPSADPTMRFQAFFVPLVDSIARSARRAKHPSRARQRAEDVLLDAERELFELAREMNDFRTVVEADLREAWEPGFSWIDISLALGQFVVQRLTQDEPYRSAVPEAMKASFGTVGTRALSVGHEVLALLRAGFPRGAQARWRTLYEITVTTRVLALGGSQTAARFRNHRYVQMAKRLEHLLPEDEARPEWHEIQRERRKYVRRHGKTFDGTYGWAAALTRRKRGVERPRFRDIEALSGLDQFKALYEMAHLDVHADAAGTWRLVSGERGSIHYGPNPWVLRPLIEATIDCLLITCDATVAAWEGYRRPPDAWLTAVRHLVDEVQVTAYLHMAHTEPDMSRIARHVAEDRDAAD